MKHKATFTESPVRILYSANSIEVLPGVCHIKSDVSSSLPGYANNGLFMTAKKEIVNLNESWI